MYIKRLAVLFVFAGIALAQSTGSIRGTITDATGALLPNATVTVSNQATGETHALKTDNAGFYSLPSLPPGAYKVEVAAPGMQTVLANDLVVAVGDTGPQGVSGGNWGGAPAHGDAGDSPPGGGRCAV